MVPEIRLSVCACMCVCMCVYTPRLYAERERERENGGSFISQEPAFSFFFSKIKKNLTFVKSLNPNSLLSGMLI